MRSINLSEFLKDNEEAILKDWMQRQTEAETLRLDLISEKELQQQSREFLRLFVDVMQQEGSQAEIDTADFSPLLQLLSEISSSRATQGFSPSETATFIFSLKQPIFDQINKISEINNKALLTDIWNINIFLDKLGLYTTQRYQEVREDVIKRQQQEMLELSTPVVKLWDGVLVLPLIGTLDSMRTQQVMESLLQKIVETSSAVAIVDITGIPMVDTLVAQHLIKTINAARLMGADCIVSGIRPQIAQTIVHLGISLQDVVTKATLSDAVSYAMQKAGFNIIRNKQ